MNQNEKQLTRDEGLDHWLRFLIAGQGARWSIRDILDAEDELSLHFYDKKVAESSFLFDLLCKIEEGSVLPRKDCPQVDLRECDSPLVAALLDHPEVKARAYEDGITWQEDMGLEILFALRSMARYCSLLVGAAAAFRFNGSCLEAEGKIVTAPLVDMTPEQLRKLLPKEGEALVKVAADLVRPKPPPVKGACLRHAGKTVFGSREDKATGQRYDIECGADSFKVMKGKDGIACKVPPSMRPFVDCLLDEYGSGAWVEPPEGTPDKWQGYCKGYSYSLREIVQGEPNGKNGFTGRYRIWIE